MIHHRQHETQAGSLFTEGSSVRVARIESDKKFSNHSCQPSLNFFPLFPNSTWHCSLNSDNSRPSSFTFQKCMGRLHGTWAIILIGISPHINVIGGKQSSRTFYFKSDVLLLQGDNTRWTAHWGRTFCGQSCNPPS